MKTVKALVRDLHLQAEELEGELEEEDYELADSRAQNVLRLARGITEEFDRLRREARKERRCSGF